VGSLIQEANNDARLAAHPSGRFDVNGNHFRLAMRAYNLNCWLMPVKREPSADATALRHVGQGRGSNSTIGAVAGNRMPASASPAASIPAVPAFHPQWLFVMDATTIRISAPGRELYWNFDTRKAFSTCVYTKR
jgi:hypothetical protein